MILSTPTGLLIGVVVGSIVGLVQFLRTVQRLSRRDRDLANSEQER